MLLLPPGVSQAPAAPASIRCCQWQLISSRSSWTDRRAAACRTPPSSGLMQQSMR